MKLSKIVIGGMRFKDRESCAATIHAAIDAGFNYIDTSPCYCHKSEQENSEAWIGKALSESSWRDRIMVSTKCAVGNGGYGFGDFNPDKGFNVRTTEQLNQVFDQSLNRLGLTAVDYYHLWTTHTDEQLQAAMEPGGWYEGVMARNDQWNHLGITTHADCDTIIRFLETGKFEAVTIPLNVINTIRMPVVEYCNRNNISVIAMNPLAGGLLARRDDLKELALRFLMKLDVHPLIGFSSEEEVAYASWIEQTMPSCEANAEEILNQVSSMMNAPKAHCTACGYCLPCPQNITVGSALSYYNAVEYLDIPEAKKAFQDRQWEDGMRLDRCTECGLCQTRCPNGLPVMEIIQDARELLYDKKPEQEQ